MRTQRLTASPASVPVAAGWRGTARPVRLRLALVGVLLALAPFSGALALLLRLPTLASVYPLCFVLLAALLLLRRRGRAALALNALTAAVVAYALVVMAALLLGRHSHLFAAYATTLAPLSLFFIGMLLCPNQASGQIGISAQQGSAKQAGMSVQLSSQEATGKLVSRPLEDEGRRRARLMYAFGWLFIGATLAVALFTLGAALFYQIEAVPATALLPGALALANLFGLALILSLSWDARRRYWLLVLGRATPAQRVTLAIGLPFYLLALGGALSLTWSRSTLIAIAVALIGVSLARRRLSEVAILSALAVPMLALSPHAPGGWLGSARNATSLFFNGAVWSHTLADTARSPLGSGIAGINDAARPQYLVTLQTLGLPGLAALASLLAIALYQCWRSYRRLRPTSGEAGGVLAAWGMLLFVVVAGLATAPLSEPLPSLFFWFFLGLANATIGAVATADAPSMRRAAKNSGIERLRGYPLRIGYLIHGDEDGDPAFSLYEQLCTLDRRRITPLVITLGSGPLATMLRGAQTHVRMVQPAIPSIKRPPASSSSTMTRLWRHRLARTLPGAFLRVLTHDMRAAWWTLVEWARLTRALLELDLDLLVSTESRLHLPGLFAGRLAGVPVQWRARDIAPPALQFALDALAAWTDGVLAESQTVARSYNLRLLGPVVKVLRPSIEPPLCPTPERRAALRRAVGVRDDDAPLLAVIGPVTATSGHHDLLAAITLLAGRYPHLRVVMASEAFPSMQRSMPKHQESVRVERLRRAICLHGLDCIVCFLGPRADISNLLAASDIAVFPQWQEPSSRGALLALAMGTPIIAARSGVFPEVLRDAWGCHLVPAHAPAALAEGFADCLDQLPQRRIDAQRNPWLVRDWFVPRVELGRLHMIYQHVCRPEPHPLRERLPARRAAAYPRRWWAALWSN